MKTVNTHVKRHFGSFADFSIAGLAVLIAVPMVLSNSRAALGATIYWNGVGARSLGGAAASPSGLRWYPTSAPWQGRPLAGPPCVAIS